jgi:hypothetical protein
MRSSIRSYIAIALAVAVLVYPTTVLAQETAGTASEGAVAGQSDIDQGRLDGERDAKTEVGSTLWFMAGCCISATGVLFAYLYTPNPPASRLLGKSPEYVAAYTDAYRAAAKGVQTSNAWSGCVVFGLSYAALCVVYFLLLSSLQY